MKESWPIEATTGDWVEFDPAKVEQAIYEIAGNPDVEPARRVSAVAATEFESGRADILSILTTALAERQDGFIASLRDEAEQTKLLAQGEVVRRWLPSGQMMSRDSLAVTQGLQIAAHLRVLSEVITLRQGPAACATLAHLARKAGSHLARQRRRSKRSSEVGTNVFIGHGRSLVWRELKDFVQDRLRLPWDEFNRVPVAGVTNVARLSEMLDAAAIAFLIMTGEDEQADGVLHARLNVVHEAGLFQGRLGFTRAIVLLEDGCEEFSNIEGLGQIRFPKGNIKAAFDDVRRVIEREGILEST
jgi:predicted nucleotide-binding protein